MDLLQLALIFLIALLSIFLTLMGIQVFLILRDMKKGLDRFNKILETTNDVATELEKPISAAAKVVDILKPKSPQKPKFYKRVMK